ncbi:hamartin-like [Teleopsis dalmanni]|uniref:hamartin n=1 Tax=Teleopsis dalmanni TaxID=139649 RepID=UPI0018CE3EE4|nr:hamartin [Teleopsis dalmanni]XP_037946276.1 hamartin-like [Teleopsis dalmanni]
MDFEKIFTDLESNQTHECEEAKRKLVDLFNQNKEQWVVNLMMDYFLKTGSQRIREVLVKVQPPHDTYIFDNLSEWLNKQQHRVQALNLFSFVVRKHPTWLYKVEKHRLIKDVIKLISSEREIERDIVPLMSALLCIITLLPIIPSLVPSFLKDLFDVFGRLASWNWQNLMRPVDYKFVHLQLGLQMLFHRLYGMYPCNFLAYLNEFIKKERGAIFHHTIKPLLETVRVHPMLVTATIESEKNHSRWKEMEPHDVVSDCAKLSLPNLYQDTKTEHMYQLSSTSLLDTPSGMHSSTSISSVSSRSMSEFNQLKGTQYRKNYASRFDFGEHSMVGGNIWSPYNEINLPGSVPLTPTPSCIRTNIPTPSNLNNIIGVTGSSPPEAAVEATPETTPLKDIKELKNNALSATSASVNPVAIRAIFPTSQPSSPMRKENNHFNFSDDQTNCSTIIDQELTSTTFRKVTHVTRHDRRLQQILQDRTFSQSPFQTIEQARQGFRSPFDDSSKCDTPDMDSDLSSHLQNYTPIMTPTPIPTPTAIEDTTKVCDDCNETEGSLCSAGGLQIPNSRSLAKSIKRRNRMASYCCNDYSYSKGGATKILSNETEIIDLKVRRTKSCSSLNIVTMKEIDEDEAKMLAIANATKKAVTTSYANAASQTIKIMPCEYEDILYEMLLENEKKRKEYERSLINPREMLDQYIVNVIRAQGNLDSVCRQDQEQFQLLYLLLQHERNRCDVLDERIRRLMGRSRDKRSLESERDRLREQLKKFETKNAELIHQMEKTRKSAFEKEKRHIEELTALKSNYLNELEQNKTLRQDNESLHTRVNEEMNSCRETNYELESLRGQIFNMNTELQHLQVQADIGQQYKHDLAHLEAEFIIMGEVQVKCRDRLLELDNFRARDEEQHVLQDSYNIELKSVKHNLEEKSSQLESAKHKIGDLQTQLTNNEKVITEQKRLLKTVKDEYEEKFKALNKKYEVQKFIVMQMEEKIMMSQIKPQAPVALNTCSPDTDKTDVASSMDRNSPLSTSLASSESLSASLRSTELRNLQQLIEVPLPEASNSISIIGANANNTIENTRLATVDSTATNTANLPIVLAINPAAIAGHNLDIFTQPHPHLHLQQQQQQQQQEQNPQLQHKR